MATYKDRRLKPCKNCGVRPVLETWASGGMMFAIRCDNPDRPDDCDNGFNLSKCRNPDEAVKRWNDWVDGKDLEPFIEKSIWI